MRYRYLDDFQSDISEFAIFSYRIAVLGTLPNAPLIIRYRTPKQKEMKCEQRTKLN